MEVPKQHHVILRGRLLDRVDNIKDEDVNDDYIIKPNTPFKTVLRFIRFEDRSSQAKIILQDVKTDYFYTMPQTQFQQFLANSMKGLIDGTFVVRKIGLYFVLHFYHESEKKVEVRDNKQRKEINKIRAQIRQLNKLVEEEF